MSRTHAATQLLALGPLTFREFVEITGWPVRDCYRTLGWLAETARIAKENRVWRLR